MAIRNILLSLYVVFLLTTSVSAAGVELFGNDRLNPGNYPAKLVPLVNASSRVYHCFVNGGEQFLYRSDADSLNGFLAAFAQTDEPQHRVLLQPGLGHCPSFEKRDVLFVWSMQFAGGLAKRLAQENLGEFVLFDVPVITVHIDGIKLEELTIPERIELVSPARRAHEVAKAASDSDSETIRNIAIDILSRINPYDREHIKLIIRCLNDDNLSVQQNAAAALRQFGAAAADQLPELRALAKKDRNEASRVLLLDAISAIENDMPDARKEARFLQQLQRIEQFIADRGAERDH